ncbi:MAG: AraC family transcriptional regulator [Candidatus Limiplasma sp.]|nr:AraC family transcriptional regulator [Candidatus Limiplasma sp.]
MRQEAPYILWAQESNIYAQGRQNTCFLRLGHRVAAPFIRPLGSHSHPEIEIVLFLSGTGVYIVNQKSYDIRPGDVFIFASAEQHCITVIDGPQGLSYLTVHFEPRFIWSMGNDLFDARFLRVFNALGKGLDNRLPQSETTREITALLQDMEREFALRQAEYEPMVKALLLRVLVLLNRQAGDAGLPVGPQLSRANYDRVEAAMEHINARLGELITLKDLAAVAHMNPCYFSTVFKQLNGIAPWTYITAKRVEQACRLLVESSMNITEIALACGYNNAANFNRAFHQVVGVPPSAYRKNPEGAQVVKGQ